MTSALYSDITPTAESIPPIAMKEIRQHQSGHRSLRNRNRKWGLHQKNQRISISSEANDLKLPGVIDSHRCERGRRERSATLEVIQPTYCRMEKKNDTEEFFQLCLHCIMYGNEERITRRSSTVLHGGKLHEVVHADVLCMRPPHTSDLKYILLTEDDLSSYTWLHPYASADSEAITNAI